MSNWPKHPWEMYELGWRKIEGKGYDQHIEEGEKWLKKAANLGHQDSMYILGWRKLEGNILRQDIVEGESWLKKAAELGDNMSMNILGWRKVEGNLLSQNIKEGENLLKKSANLGNSAAMCNLGIYKVEGNYLAQNVTEGEKWLKKAAMLGYDRAMYILGWRKVEGNILSQNIEEGEKWLKKAADLEHRDSMYILGWRKLEGNILRQDIAEGESWLKKAAELEHPDATNILGWRKVEGNLLSQNIEEGENLLKKAINRGSAAAMCNLGIFKVEGYHLSQDVIEGEEWLKKAAMLGYDRAMYILGWRKVEGNLLSQNSEEGEKWLKKAADYGHSGAINILGWRKIEGNKLEQNVAEGEKWLKKAIELGNLDAKYNLGYYLVEGMELEQNVEKGKKLLQEAADQGHQKSIHYLESRKNQWGDREKTRLQSDQLSEESEKRSKGLFEIDHESLKESMNELTQMVGLTPVKEYVSEIKDMVSLQVERQRIGQKVTISSNHMLFTGNPGTGKTTVARIVSKIFHALGVVSKGHLVEVTREDLVAEYIGQTAIKTKKMIQKALGGVLFIDEAYTLARGGENDFGKEAIDTLVKAMEEHRTDLIVILTGYTKEMQEFLKTNSGLISRFPHMVEFPDYTPEELLRIAKKLLAELQFQIHQETEKVILDVLKRRQIPGRNDVGNGRLVRNLIEEAIRKQSKRLSRKGDYSQTDLQTLIAEDFKSEESSSSFDLEKEFSKIVGNEEMKQYIRTLMAQLRIRKLREEQGLQSGFEQSLHMVFTGNPGTGKTTFARLIGRIMKEIGVLKSGQLIETDRGGLVAGFKGQTALKVQEKIKEALGGILFIDEAYSLASGGSEDFGREAIDTLVKEMEDHRENLVVILAGYQNEMEHFFQTNPGLRSRFPIIFQFHDYTAEEMYQILENLATSSSYKLAPGCKEYVIKQCQREINSQKSSNGRFVRNLFEHAIRKQSLRLQDDPMPDIEDLMRLEPVDFAEQ